VKTGPFSFPATLSCRQKLASRPNRQAYQTDRHHRAERAGKNELSAYPFAAADKFFVMMIQIVPLPDIPNQPHLFARLAVRGEKSSAVHVLVEQRIASAQHNQ